MRKGVGIPPNSPLILFKTFTETWKFVTFSFSLLAKFLQNFMINNAINSKSYDIFVETTQ